MEALKMISLAERVSQEVGRALGVADPEAARDIADYLIDRARHNEDEDSFFAEINKVEESFTFDLASNIYFLVRSTFPVAQPAKIPDELPQATETATKATVFQPPEPEAAVTPYGFGFEELPVDWPKLEQAMKEARDRHLGAERHKRIRKTRAERLRGGSRRDPNESFSSSETETEEVVPQKVFRGEVTKIFDYGMLIRVRGRRHNTGLVHISKIRDERIENLSDLFAVGDPVFAKCIEIREDGKVLFSMRNINQKTGIEVKSEEVDFANRRSGTKIRMDAETLREYEAYLMSQEYGPLTGIKLDFKGTGKATKSAHREIDLWEATRLKYNKTRALPEGESEGESAEYDEENLDIVLNQAEPEFLKGKAPKKGASLSPVRLVQTPEGAMQMGALNAQNFAKERRRQQNELIDNMAEMGEGDMQKINEDPLTKAKPLLAGDLRQLAAEEVKKLRTLDIDELVGKGPQAKTKEPEKPKRAEAIPSAPTDNANQLPIHSYKDALLQKIAENQILIVIGETGSGKTTQMTQYLLRSGMLAPGKKIGCTQPRRIAARSVAKRVSEEMGCELGKEVGYSIRFEDVTSRWTRIKYLTDGMLIREIMLDENLSGYGFIILDEAHERNIHTDVLFTLMKQIVRKNPNLRLIITSATLDAVKFSGFFDNCQVFRIPGRSFEVKVMFAREPELDYLKAGTDCVLQIHLSEPPGDILFFLTGQEEIETAASIIEKRLSDLGKDAPPMLIHQIYSALPSEKQSQIFEPAPNGFRKCVIATNIAEASITIDGILYVVDSGFSKVKVYNPKLGMDSLRVTPISQASANQRSGRAGRTAPGKCYRLYTEKSFKTEMLPVSVPEIQRSNLAHTVLILKSLGIHDVLHFELMDPPPIQSLVAALQNLFTLGALDENGRMTRLGQKMAELPLEPPLAKVLLASVDLICSEEMATIVALLSVQGVFFRPKDKQNIADERKKRFLKAEGDHLTLLSVFENWQKNNHSATWCHDNFIHFRSMKRAQDIREQLIGQLSQAKLPVLSCRGDYQRIQKALTSGFFEHAAKREPKEGYKTIADNHQVFVHPSSAIFQKTPEYVIYHELVMTSREYMREITPILPKWLVEVAPNYYQLNTQGRKNEVIKPLNYNKNDPKAGDWKLQNRIRDLSSILR